MERPLDDSPPPALWAANMLAGHASLRADYHGLDDPHDAIRRYRRFEWLVTRGHELEARASVTVTMALLWHYRPSDDVGRVAKTAIWSRLASYL